MSTQVVLHRQLGQQGRVKKSGTSIYRGVSKRSDGKYVAYIKNLDQKFYLGYFESEVEAARAYDQKAKEIWGTYARLNFPEEN